MTDRSPALAATATGAILSAVAAIVTVVNASSIPRPSRAATATATTATATATESIVVCVPARDEAPRIAALVSDLRAQTQCADLTVIILDDASTDATFTAAVDAAGDDPRITVLQSDAEPTPGWTGKAAACAALATVALEGNPDLIVFVDADVRLEATAVAALAAVMRSGGAALVCPWPEQLAVSPAEWLIQPLLSFSWMSSLPIRLANASTRPSTVVACGQFMMFDASAYRAIGGHASVASSVVEDLDIARVLRRTGHRTAVVSGAGVLRCRMYDGWPALRDGYTRWLWTAYGGVPGTVTVVGALAVVYLVPPAAALFGRGSVRRWGVAGYCAGVLARVVAARAESTRWSLRSTAAAAAHPVSVGAYIGLTAESLRRRARGLTAWKGRPI